MVIMCAITLQLKGKYFYGQGKTWKGARNDACRAALVYKFDTPTDRYESSTLEETGE